MYQIKYILVHNANAKGSRFKVQGFKVQFLGPWPEPYIVIALRREIFQKSYSKLNKNENRQIYLSQ